MASRNRGRKKAKLRDLSRHEPDLMQALAVTDKLHKKHPIAAAILGAVAVENALETRLRERLAPRSDDLWDQLTDERGSLGTFYRKIQMARALRLKDIRNAFAHAKRLIDFDHTLVVDELRKIQIPHYQRRGHRYCKAVKFGPTSAYEQLCHYLLIHLVNANLKRMHSANKRREARTEAMELANLIGSTEALMFRRQSTSGGILGPALDRLLREGD